MDAAGFERGLGIQLPKQGRAAGTASVTATASSSSALKFKSDAIVIPGASSSLTLGGPRRQMVLPGPPPPLPSFNARKGMQLPNRSASTSAISSRAPTPAEDDEHGQASSSVLPPSSTSLSPQTFDAVVIPIASSPTVPNAPSSQAPRKRAERGKSKTESTQFQKPTPLSTFLDTKSSESANVKSLLEEVKSELKSSAEDRKKKTAEEVIPRTAKKLKACPFCSGPWPARPSAALLELVEPLLQNLHAKVKVDMRARMMMCGLHEAEAKHIPEGEERGWPKPEEIDWETMEDRFFTGGEKGQYSWIMRQLSARVADPESSARLRRLKEKAAQGGIWTVTSADGVLETMEEEQVGYFGEVGQVKMMEWLRRAFIDQHGSDSDAFTDGQRPRLDASAQASLYPLNSKSFIARCLVPELAACFIKIRENCTYDEAETIREESSAYGHAILPIVAEEDVGQFLDFDLDKDEHDVSSTPRSTSSVNASQATPTRRSKRVATSMSSSPEVTRIADRQEQNERRAARLHKRSRLDDGDDFFKLGQRDTGKPVHKLDRDGSPPRVPSSSATSSTRPRARKFTRMASTASTHSVYSDDEDVAFKCASQPTQSQPPASSQQAPGGSQRPRPRPVPARGRASQSAVEPSMADDNVAGPSNGTAEQETRASASNLKPAGPPETAESTLTHRHTLVRPNSDRGAGSIRGADVEDVFKTKLDLPDMDASMSVASQQTPRPEGRRSAPEVQDRYGAGKVPGSTSGSASMRQEQDYVRLTQDAPTVPTVEQSPRPSSSQMQEPGASTSSGKQRRRKRAMDDEGPSASQGVPIYTSEGRISGEKASPSLGMSHRAPMHYYSSASKTFNTTGTAFCPPSSWAHKVDAYQDSQAPPSSQWASPSGPNTLDATRSRSNISGTFDPNTLWENASQLERRRRDSRPASPGKVRDGADEGVKLIPPSQQKQGKAAGR